MKSVLVSVVIPCYNQGKYLEETVQSVLASSYRPLEVLLVNDGSIDNSLEVAMSLQRKHKELTVIDQANGGVAKARNTGVRAAKGEIILPLDGDDKISADYIGAGVELLRERAEVKVVYCKAVKFSEAGQKPWKLKPFSLAALARDNMIFVAALFRKADALAVGGFSEDMHMGREDWEFWIKMLKDGGEVVQLPFVGFYYRMTPDSKRKKTGTGKRKRERIAYLNARHRDFFERELNGPLRFQRSWSRAYNTLLRWVGKI
ncbi:glycosyltransferase family A protein [Cyclobacterium sp.]|uniref:glycosyltransferase family 2 protein n=1 Tax=Cyclobacterium sp. TaxID=1966343 RepID=UPI0019839D3D|nr:glycosyltransferase family A protein [Cyclobacterium sp.]MBD3630675.1 glycosyltransferase family 2 protein [Cyclobacterium sp.]